MASSPTPSRLDPTRIDLPDHRGGRWRVADQIGRPVLLVFHRHLM